MTVILNVVTNAEDQVEMSVCCAECARTLCLNPFSSYISWWEVFDGTSVVDSADRWLEE